MKAKKVLSVAMAMSMVMGMSVMAHAEGVVEVTKPTESLSEIVTVSVISNIEAAVFSVDVPTNIVVDLPSTGKSMSCESATHTLVNRGDAPVVIASVDLVESDTWKHIKNPLYDNEDYNGVSLLDCVGENKFDIHVNGEESWYGESLFEDETHLDNMDAFIGVGESTSLEYELALSPVSPAKANENICNLEYCLDWYTPNFY